MDDDGDARSRGKSVLDEEVDVNGEMHIHDLLNEDDMYGDETELAGEVEYDLAEEDEQNVVTNDCKL